jgi:hypothetical protein
VPLTLYRKFGKVAPNFAGPSRFYTLPGATFGMTTIAGEWTVPTATFTLTDGQLGDDTGVDEMIVDPGGPVLPAPTGAPAVSRWGLIALVGLLSAAAAVGLWRRAA